MKNSNDTIGNRSRDLPVCSAVPQSLRPRAVDRVDMHKYVESKDMASQQVGPPDWNLGLDTSNTPTYQFHHVTKSGRSPT
jgi:hypothetical protein